MGAWDRSHPALPDKHMDIDARRPVGDRGAAGTRATTERQSDERNAEITPARIRRVGKGARVAAGDLTTRVN